MEVRIERAVALLLWGVPIASAAQQGGFYDQSHLNRHLKRHLGITPGQILPRRVPRAFLKSKLA